MDALTLDQFVVFVTVVDRGSFAAAARHLGRAQSAITYALQKLEDQTGVALFDRSAYRPSLTEAGHALLPRARRIVDSVADFRLQAGGIAKGLEAELTLIVDRFLAIDMIAEPLAAFRETYPSVQLRIDTEWHDKSMTELVEGRADLGFLVEFRSFPPTIARDYCGYVDLTAVTAPEHPLAQMPAPVAPETLRDHLQIVVADPKAAKTGRDYGVVGLNRWIVGDHQIKHGLLRAGVGWGSMPRPIVAADIAGGRLREIVPARWDGADRMPRLPVVVAHCMDHARGPAANWLLDRLVAVGGNTSDK